MASQRPTGGTGGEPLFTIDFEKSLAQRPELPRALAEAEHIDPSFFSLETDVAAVAKMGVQCHNIHLLNLHSWPEFKTVWGKRCYKPNKWVTVCVPWPYIYRRVCTRSYFLQVCHPSLGDILQVIIDCLRVSVTEALLAMLIQKKFDVFLVTLRSVLINCLQQKGVKLLEQFSIGIREEVSCSAWQPV